ncbi:MAG: efflux RND transporter periplasmic adaptor subunit, partial [Thermoanaerobaculum sp.]
ERARELQEKAEALQKALELARERKTWATLRAPIDGTVTNLVRRAGDLLQVGDEVLTVVNLKEAYLRAAVDERDLGKVTPGQEARIVFEAFRDNIFVGRVWRVVPHLDRLTRSADVLIRLPEGIPALSLDLTATVNIVIRTVEGATLVPKQALRGTGEERTVLRPGPDARLEAVPIRVGACDVEQCQVVAGLQPGDLIVANPANVKPGERVKLQ